MVSNQERDLPLPGPPTCAFINSFSLFTTIAHDKCYRILKVQKMPIMLPSKVILIYFVCMPQLPCGSKRTVSESSFPLSTMWLLELELWSPSLAASVLPTEPSWWPSKMDLVATLLQNLPEVF